MQTALKHTTSCHPEAWESNLQCDQNMAYGVCLLPSESQDSTQQGLNSAIPKYRFKIYLNPAVGGSWPQLSDLVPLMKRLTCLKVRVLMRGPQHFMLSLIKSRCISGVTRGKGSQVEMFSTHI